MGLTSGSLQVDATVSGLLGRADRHHIAAEEDRLCGLPGYLDCSRRTKKLISFISQGRARPSSDSRTRPRRRVRKIVTMTP
jgi:hypothetical protein